MSRVKHCSGIPNFEPLLKTKKKKEDIVFQDMTYAVSHCRFDIVGYGCMTCIGNSGPLPTEVSEAIEKVR